MERRDLFLSVVLISTFLLAPLPAEETAPSTTGSLKWKCAAWWGPEGSVKAAKEMGFNAIIAGFFGERLTKTVEEGKKHGVEVYLDIEFLGGGKHTQVMTRAEEERVASKKAAIAPDVATWKPGKRGDPFGLRLWCFARPEALEYGKAKIEKYLPKSDIGGVCLDAIGFRNQYGCHCDFCREAIKVLAAKHPTLGPQAAADKFAEETLCRFIAGLAAFTRALRPKIKIAVHIEPTFAPSPAFASKLPVDYWMTSVSYYSKPHWPPETVRRLSTVVARAQGKAVGIPYLGFLSGKSLKTPQRLSQELRSVVDSGASGIALFELSEIVKDPAMALAVRRVLAAEAEK